jgi:multiple sugar transport system substrate-binding protein
VYDTKNPIAHYTGDATAAPDVSAITGKGFDVYGLPVQANALVMAYRKDLLSNSAQQAAYQQQTGKQLAPPTTWDDYATVAKFFTQPDKKLYGTTVMAGVGDWATDDFKSLLGGFGGNGHLIGDKLTMDFNSPEGVKALEYYRKLITSGVVPPGSTSASWDEVASSFDSGLTAMTMNYHALALDSAVSGGQIGYAAVPKGSAQAPHFGTWMLSVNKYSTNKEWAYRAISWVTAAEQQLAMTKQQLHPTRVSVYQQVGAAGSADAEFYQALGESLALGDGRPRLTNYTEVSQAIAVAVNDAATGKKDPKAALDSAASQVKKLLQQAGYNPGS